MKKKILFALSLVSLVSLGTFALASCGEEQPIVEPPVEETRYSVVVSADSSVTVSGIVESYKVGDTVTFTVSTSNLDKRIGNVTSEQVTISSSNGSYSFVMPNSNVTIVVTLADLDATIGGQGTETDPYIIDNRAKLSAISEGIANETLDNTGYFVLGADINMEGLEWTPIGDMTTSFNGVFDGNGYSITNLSIENLLEYQSTYQTYRFAGLFGVTDGASIYDLDLSLSVNLTAYGSNSVIDFGGISAIAFNTVVQDTNITLDEFSITSYQNGDYSGLFVGGVLGDAYATEEGDYSTYVDLSRVTVTGDISINTDDAQDPIIYVGGIAGSIDTNYGANIYNINNSLFVGDIEGGTYVGGILGSGDYLSSVTSSIAIGDTLVGSGEVAYVGGIAGSMRYETMVMNTYSSYKTLSAPVDTGSYYSSYAGNVMGMIYDGAKDYGSNINDAGIYNCNYLEATVIGDDINHEGTLVETADFSKISGFSTDIWDFSGEIPALKEDINLEREATITIDDKDESTANSTVEIAADDYDYAGVLAIESASFEKANHHFNGLSYDEEGTVMYRWYVPFSTDATLYAKFTDLTPVLGSFSWTSYYYENTMASGYFTFDEDYLYWFTADHAYLQYEYELFDSYILIGDCLPSSDGNVWGGYSDSIFYLQDDGSILGYDVNDSDAYYVGTKISTVVSVPDYSETGLVGTWNFSNGATVTFYDDGFAIGNRSGSTVDYSGGYLVTGNQVDLTVFSVMSATFTYDSTSGLLIDSDNRVGTKETISASYSFSSTDLNFVIYVIGENTYVIENGAVSSKTVEGTLVDGGTVVIDGRTYAISGTTLADVTPEPDEPTTDPDTPSSSIPAYCGTWSGKVGLNDVTIVINSDGTATYGGTPADSNYTVNGNVIKFTLGDGSYTITITYNETNNSIDVVYYDEYEYYEFEGTLTTFVPETPAIEEPTPEEPSSSLPAYCGTWTGSLTNGSCTIVINSDGTASFNGTSSDENYVVNGNTITFTYGSGEWILTCVFDEATGSLKVTLADEYDEYSFTGTLSSFVAEQPATSEPSEPVTTNPAYCGTWTGSLTNGSCTIIINSDGTASFNGTASDENYVVNGNTITFTYGYGEWILTCVYNEANNSLSVTLTDEYDEYLFTGTLTTFTPEAN